MNLTSMDLYILTRLDGLHGLVVFCVIVPLIATSVYCFAALMCTMDYDYDEEKGLPWFKVLYVKTAICLVVVAACISLTVPTTKEMALIFVAPKLVNNGQVQKLPINILKLANTKIEELIETTIKKTE